MTNDSAPSNVRALAALPIPYDLETATRHAGSARETWREYQAEHGEDREMVKALDALDDAQQAIRALIHARVSARQWVRQNGSKA